MPSNESATHTLRCRTPVRGEDAAHEDAGAAAPHAGLDQVTGHVVGEDGLHAVLQVVQPFEADHRVRGLRPVHPVGAPLEVELGALHGRRPVLEQVEVELPAWFGHVRVLRGSSGSPGDRQLDESSGDPVVVEPQVLVAHREAQAGQPRRQRGEHDPQLDVGQCGADAVVGAVAEAEVVLTRFAPDVEPVGFRVHRAVPVRDGGISSTASPVRMVIPAMSTSACAYPEKPWSLGALYRMISSTAREASDGLSRRAANCSGWLSSNRVP
jgi:hypothetical protein